MIRNIIQLHPLILWRSGIHENLSLLSKINRNQK